MTDEQKRVVRRGFLASSSLGFRFAPAPVASPNELSGVSDDSLLWVPAKAHDRPKILDGPRMTSLERMLQPYLRVFYFKWWLIQLPGGLIFASFVLWLLMGDLTAFDDGMIIILNIFGIGGNLVALFAILVKLFRGILLVIFRAQIYFRVVRTAPQVEIEAEWLSPVYDYEREELAREKKRYAREMKGKLSGAGVKILLQFSGADKFADIAGTVTEKIVSTALGGETKSTGQ